MTPVTDSLIEQIKNRIVKAVNPERIFLFGSHAKGTADSSSDVDFLVIEDAAFGQERSRRKEAAYISRNLDGFDVPIDILVYSRQEVDEWKSSINHIVARALREGKLLYERC